jgi:uncharacterized protein with FMN-binding domain
MEPNQTQKTSGFKAIYGLVIAILALGGGFIFWNSKQNNSVSQTTTSQPSLPATNDTSSTPAVTDNRKYKDGTYTAPGAYTSPEGRENISITLVIKDDIVTDATFSGSSREKTSEQYMAAFSQGFKTEVVGKSLDEISLTVVNGSSLTPKGFMDALAKIKTQAKA